MTKPVITLLGEATVSLELGRSYTDEGATATDNIDGDISSNITTTGVVDTNTTGTYTLTYNVMDAARNAADEVTREVIVTADVTKPVITRLGEATVSLELGRSYTDEGATATDNIDGDISSNITTTGVVDTNTTGTYTVRYNVSDSATNAADEVTREVIVTADVTKPVITRLGEATVSLELGRSYTDEGATATDNIDGDISSNITTTGLVDTNTTGTYTLTYNVMDAARNAADEVTREVIVTADVTKPVITRLGEATVSLELGRSYTDEGATATDNIDGNISSNITTTGVVDTNTTGTYTVRYNVSDSATNAADEVTREVIVTADVTKPVITLLGEATVSLELGRSYTDEGATATDNIDGDISSNITTTGVVDTNTTGTYTVRYNVSDSATNAADEVTREVIVTADVTKPVITRLGEATVSLELGRSYTDEGATATDNIDGDISSNITTTGVVDTNTTGTYKVRYNVSDSATNAADEVTREVIVTADVTKPVITRLGEATVSLELGRSYTDEGATATDNIDGDISGNITTTGVVDTNTTGTYTVRYNVSDSATNAADEVTREVIVTADVTKPVITLLGEATVSLELGSSYTDEGATATDNIDGDITSAITTTNPVDTNIAATYTITYKVSDAALNAAEPVTRTVIVTADVTKPVITLNGPATVSLERGNTYTELGATAEDNIDGPIDSSRIEIDSTNVDTNTVGTYTVTYNVIDAALNPAEPVTREVIVVDTTPPTVTIEGIASSVNVSPVTVTITFSEAVTGFEKSGIMMSNNVTLTNFSGGVGSTYTVSVTATANGPLSLSVLAEVAKDAAGNLNTASRVIRSNADITAPRVRVLNRLSPIEADTNVNTLIWSITFSEAVKNVNPSDFILGGSTVIPSVEILSGLRQVYVTASDGDITNFNGDVTLGFADTPGIQDLAGNPLTNTIPTSSTNEDSYTIDNTPPTVVSIKRSSPTDLHTNADSVTWRITFSEAVSNADASDFSLSGTTASLTHREESSTELDISTASDGDLADLNADITLSFITNPTIQDAVGNALTNTTPTSGTNEDSYTIDNTALTVVSIKRQNPTTKKTNVDSVTWRITFSKAVSNADASNFSLSGTTTSLTHRVESETELDITTASDGDLADLNADITLSFISIPTIHDALGNTLTNTTPTSSTNEDSYTIDNTPPTVVSIKRSSPTDLHTNADSVTWRITFSEAVSNADASDFSLSGTTASLTHREESSTELDISTASDGDLADLNADITLSFITNPTIQDAVGNALTNTTPTSGTNEDSYTIDNTALTVVSIKRQNPTTKKTNVDSVRWSILFNEEIKTPDANNFILSTGSRVIPTLVTVSRLEVDVATRDDGKFEVNITASDGDITDFNGDVTLGFAETHDIQDLAGNPLTDITPTVTNESTFTFDNVRPKVRLIQRMLPTVAITDADSVTWNILFSEAVKNVAKSDFILIGRSTAIPSVRIINGSQVEVTASGGDLSDFSGYVTLGFADTHDIRDLAGNLLTNIPPFGFTDQRFRLDNTPPEVVSIERSLPIEATTNADRVTWSIRFNEKIKTPDASDFTLKNGPTVVNVSRLEVSAITRFNDRISEVYITAIGGDITDFNGDVTLGFADPHDIEDVFGHPLTNTTPTRSDDNTFTFDNAGPYVVSIRRGGEGAVATNADSVGWAIAFNEAIKTPDESDFILSDSTAMLEVDVNPGGAGLYYVTALGGDLSDFNGDVALGIADGHDIQDAVGNPLTNTTLSRDANKYTFKFDNIAPTVTIEDVPEYINIGASTATVDFTATIRFSEAVSGFKRGDITFTNANLGAFNGSGRTYTVLVSPANVGIVTLQVAADAGVVKDAAGNGNSASAVVMITVDALPEITLKGKGTVNLKVGDEYVERGATASDHIDGDITANIVIGGDVVDTQKAGTYTLTYDASDGSGNAAKQKIRRVIVVDMTPPVLTLRGRDSYTVASFSAYLELGVTARDNADGDITDQVVRDIFDITEPGSIYFASYRFTYNVSDSSGNAAKEVTRTLHTLFD